MTYPSADHLQILNVMHGYTMAVDDKDVAAIRAAFHPDARIIAFGNDFSLDEYCIGIPKLIERMNSVHMIANEHVTIDGDRAVARSYVYAWHSVPANLDDPGADAIFGAVKVDTDSLILGRYEDTLEKRDGAWRIACKRIVMKWQQHLPSLPPFPGWSSM